MSLRLKLVLGFVGIGVAAILIVALLVNRATETAFGRYVFEQEGGALSSALAAEYARQGSWPSVAESFEERPGAGHGMMPGRMGMAREGFAVADQSGRVVIAGAGYHPRQIAPRAVRDQGLPIEVDGQVVGTLIRGGRVMSFLPPAGAQFLNHVNRMLLVAGVGAVALALVLAIALSGRLTSSLRELKTATEAVAHGELGRQVNVHSGDEVGDLADAFNQMSSDLARASATRRNLTADIAHELRTPLSLILGHAEALADGVLPRSDENLRLIHQEASRLNRIVEDLRTLTLAEAGELSLSPETIDPGELARKTLAARKSTALEKEIRWQIDIPAQLPTVNVDPDRIQQALGNLLDNAMHHTPRGGRASLSVQVHAGFVQFVVEDEGTGIKPEDLPRLFERFYRSDRARSRGQGGSGLGLSIAKSLVEGHEGRIWAENRERAGARFVLELPTAEGASNRPDDAQ